MAIALQFTTTASTSRLTAVSGSNRETWATSIASLACTIHPNSGEHAEMTGGAFYSTHKMFCATGVDIRVGDRVVVGSDTYTVKGVESYAMGTTDANKHIRVALLKGV